MSIISFIKLFSINKLLIFLCVTSSKVFALWPSAKEKEYRLFPHFLDNFSKTYEKIITNDINPDKSIAFLILTEPVIPIVIRAKYIHNSKEFLTGFLNLIIERAPTIPHANITNWNKYISDIKNRKWDYIVPGHGELIKIKEQLLLTKYWINYIDKTAKQAVLNGTSPAEIFNEGIPASLRKYKLAKETWIRDLPLLINKYESE